MSGDETYRPRIGLSANILHRDDDRELYDGRPLLYLEQSMATWVLRAGGRPYLIPFAPHDSGVDTGLEGMLAGVDGLLLQGGADMAPASYGESPLEERWSGDPARDQYELALFEHALDRRMPILGVCRGAQVINVARGGTLYQDLETQLEGGRLHRDRSRYDELTHRVEFEPDSHLAELYSEPGGLVSSVHHQGIRALGDGLRVEARSSEDGLVEAVRLAADELYVLGVQWHPEFHEPGDSSLLSPMPIIEDFLEEVRDERAANA